MDSYFTTDVMGLDLGDGAKIWSGATAAILEAGVPRVVENEQGSRSTPSVIAFTDGGEVLVGQPAKKLLFSNRATPVSAHSLLLGLSYDSEEVAKLRDAGAFGSLDVADESGAAVIRVHDVSHHPEELSARILSSLKDAAESALGNRSVFTAVVGAPVGASPATRAALMAAGKRSGLRKVVLLDAAVAGAGAAALELPELEPCQRIGVFMLGGRSCSFSVLDRTDGGSSAADDGDEARAGWAVRAAQRQALLGAEDFDVSVVDHLVSGFQADHGIDLSGDHLALQRLHEAAETAKLELCKESAVAISLPFITADADGPKHLEQNLSRSRFESIIAPTLEGSTAVCEAAIADAGVSKSDLHAIVLLGGSARLAAVERHVSSLFAPIPTLRTAAPEEAVALGTAAYAQQLQALEYNQ